MTAAEKVAQTVHIKRKGETQSLVQRRSLGCGKHIGCIKAHNIKRESRTKPEILAVALILALSFLHISEPPRVPSVSCCGFCLLKKKIQA